VSPTIQGQPAAPCRLWWPDLGDHARPEDERADPASPSVGVCSHGRRSLPSHSPNSNSTRRACNSRTPAASQAVALGKPWVLDPVGCGATPYRTQMCLALLQLRPTVVRGNASEILALAGAAGGCAAFLVSPGRNIGRRCCGLLRDDIIDCIDGQACPGYPGC
jgi:hypothetical protein